MRVVLVISVDSAFKCSAPQVTRPAVAEVTLHTPGVYHLALDLPEGHDVNYASGQYLNIMLGDRHRSFSWLRPSKAAIHCWYRKIDDATQGILEKTQPGDSFDVELPHGASFPRKRLSADDICGDWYGLCSDQSDSRITARQRRLPAHSLLLGVRERVQLYLLDEIQSWASRLYEFTFIPVLSRTLKLDRSSYIKDAIAETDDLSEHSIYLCGSPHMIQDAKAIVGLARHGEQMRTALSSRTEAAAAVAELND